MVNIISAASTVPRAAAQPHVWLHGPSAPRFGLLLPLPSVHSDRLSLWRALRESRLLFSELSVWQRFSSSSCISLVMSGALGLKGISFLAERHIVILTTCASSRPRDRARLAANNLQVLPSLGSRRERWGLSRTIRDVSNGVHLFL